jgi:protein O-GlcNAc transferase
MQSEEKRLQEVRYECTSNFAEILQHCGISLLVSTYQAGKVMVLGSHAGQLKISYLHFDRAMGLAADRGKVAIGTRRQIHFLQPSHEIAPQVEPAGTHDACLAIRSSFYTGNIHGHDLAWGREGLWVVNTLFSCLCTLDDSYNFVPRWRPPFVSQLIDQDRCHLNGLALQNGEPNYVTVLAQSDEPAGWRPTKATSGCVLDIASGQAVTTGLSMPHSPRVFQDRLFVLNSGRGELGLVDLPTGKVQPIDNVPGYTRGLSFAGQFAFVGLSKIRETNIFGGLPISEKAAELKCGVAIIDLVSGRTVSAFQFHSGVEEIFAVEALPGCLNPAVFGMGSEADDDHPEVWIVPSPGSVPPRPVTQSVYHRPVQHELTKTPGALLAPHDDARGVRPVASALDSLTVPALVDAGNRCQEQADVPGAIACYRKALQKDPRCVPARQNLGYVLLNQGETDEAVEQYQELLSIAPTPMNRLLDALALPVVYHSNDHLEQWRQRLESRLTAMVEDKITIDTSSSLVPTLFHLAYHGKNDASVMRMVGQIYRVSEQEVMNSTSSLGTKSGTRRSQRVRVGFLSAYFRDHTIGKLNLGRIRGLDRQRFEVVVLYASSQNDIVVEQFRQYADQWVAVPRDPAAARRLIRESNLDVLIFADVGMDALTTTLAYSRMAPVQCVTWGHPDTTGSPNIDYFLSSELLEIDNAEHHYTEKLVRLPLLATYYYRPVLSDPARSRSEFGLAGQDAIYLCPQTSFKYHPSFDEVIAGVLKADPHGRFVVLEGRSPTWTQALKERWRRSLGSTADRIHWLPVVPHADFLSLLSCADVILDPLHFGGGNTTYEALAMGTPVVTLPGKFLRNRISSALYKKMGVSDCTVQTVSEYIEVCTNLTADKNFANAVRSKIDLASACLFEDPAEIKCLEDFLLTVA